MKKYQQLLEKEKTFHHEQKYQGNIFLNQNISNPIKQTHIQIYNNAYGMKNILKKGQYSILQITPLMK